MSRNNPRPDVDEACRQLRDFQLASVDYAFNRLYRDADRIDRFLIADEVGLGKTWVARGVIARAVDHLWDRKERIDVLYICSNAEIARQNIDRLNLGSIERALASRLTLLPLELRNVSEKGVNFVSFTPATSLEFGRSAGAQRERAVLYWLLHEIWGIKGSGAKNLLRANVGAARWRDRLAEITYELEHDPSGKQRPRFDAAIIESFTRNLDAEPDLRVESKRLANALRRSRTKVPRKLRDLRNHLIARLRRVLAASCLAIFKPDLIILDEFQRFRHLLDQDDEAARLARQLFDAKDAKILLLSATPYKMYTVSNELEGDDHYRDFIRTCGFLLPKSDVAALTQDLAAYRKALCGHDAGMSLETARRSIEGRLRKVMCRTERLASSSDRDGALKEMATPVTPFEPDDFLEYRAIARLAKAVDVDDPIELWKSSPYLLNVMEDSYRLKERLKEGIGSRSKSVLAALAETLRWQIPWGAIEAYQAVDPRNPRLRALIDGLSKGPLWKLLWLPASLPYYDAQGAFAGTDAGASSHTKVLAFSSWKIVPRSISMFVSYAMERLMVRQGDTQARYATVRKKHGPRLRWAEERGTLRGLPLFTLFYPCLTLARRIDPLAYAQKKSRRLPRRDLERQIGKEISSLLAPVIGKYTTSNAAQSDPRWYWAAPMLLDRHHAREVRRWLLDESRDWRWWKAEREDGTQFQRHVEAVIEQMNDPRLGRPPDDLVEVLTRICLGSPATVILRTLLRHVKSPESAWRSAASHASGFRSLFNLPESILLLNGLERGRRPYWRKVLNYCCDGNLQAVIDEYAHVLVDLHTVDRGKGDAADKIGAGISASVSLPASTLAYDTYRVSDGRGSVRQRRIRCRFAQRFGDEKSEDGEETRESSLREAFNSPFRPFILTSTSVGQEGLDFHAYSHALMHWNLPTNPVDLEQREGRVHRFKGYFIRKNLARKYDFAGTRGVSDPWQSLFDHAVAQRAAGASDMIPFWVFEGQFHVERHLPVLPLSREAARIDDLKESLALYRLTFGQPRQEELLKFLKRRALAGDGAPDSAAHIDLRPPDRGRRPASRR